MTLRRLGTEKLKHDTYDKVQVLSMFSNLQ